MDLPYDALRTFAVVAETGSFTKSAKKILRSQSAVSLQVAKLEEVTGRRLLDRTTKRVGLTEAGLVLFGYVRQTEALLQQAAQALWDLDQMERGRLVICTSDTTGCYRLPAILLRYRRKHPGIEIEVRNATSPRTIDAVLEHEVDLGIVTLAYLRPGLEAIELFRRNDVLICHPEHRLAKRRRVFLKDLERYQFILLDRRCSSRCILDERCAAARVRLPIHMELSSIEVIKRLVRIDVGLSVVPEISVNEEVAANNLSTVTITDLKGAPSPWMGIIYKQGRYRSLAVESFIDELQAFFKSGTIR